MSKKKRRSGKSGAVELDESELQKAEGGTMQIFVKTIKADPGSVEDLKVKVEGSN